MENESKKLKNVVKQRVDKLHQLYEWGEAQQMVRVLMEHYFGIDRVKIVLEPEFLLNDSQLKQLDAAIDELMHNKPLQYVIGEMEFFDLKFTVNSAALIPRPETEEMLGLICRQWPRNAQLNILDIGTGTGCIAISLAKFFPNSSVSALDVSESAIALARQNAQTNEADINFFYTDILKIDELTNHYDLIVSNPPYVCEHEKMLMHHNVLDYEPSLALFVPDNNPLIFYNKIASLAYKALNPQGQLWFEINEAYADATCNCCLKAGFASAESIVDFREKPRFCKAMLNKESAL